MDYELIFWVVSAIVGAIGFGILLWIGKKEDEKYIDVEGREW